jgi:hypothetical protein
VVAGSNPAAPTNSFSELRALRFRAHVACNPRVTKSSRLDASSDRHLAGSTTPIHSPSPPAGEQLGRCPNHRPATGRPLRCTRTSTSFPRLQRCPCSKREGGPNFRLWPWRPPAPTAARRTCSSSSAATFLKASPLRLPDRVDVACSSVASRSTGATSEAGSPAAVHFLVRKRGRRTSELAAMVSAGTAGCV